MARQVRSQISLHELDNYTFGTKEAKPEKDSLVKRMSRMTEKYKEEGMRRTVECVLLLQNKQHPHVLLLQQGQGQNAVFRLPGGRLRPGEGELEGTRRKLSSKLAPPREAQSQTHQAKWMVEEQLAVWWRPNFETLMYPYLPAHVTKPKECKKICMVRLSERQVFAVPRNFKLLAVPLFELYDNAARYGPVIASLPHLISRYEFAFVASVPAALAEAAPTGQAKPKPQQGDDAAADT